MKLIKLMTALFVACVATSAIAAPKIYAGIEGGYNKMSVSTEGYTGSTNVDGNWTDATTESRKKPNTFANVHVGMLFPVSTNLSLGGQLGYSYYGQYTTSESFTRTLTSGVNSGNVTVNKNTTNKTTISSVNLLGVAKYKIDSFNVTGLAGVGEFIMSSSGSELVNNRPGQDLTTNVGEAKVANHEALTPIAGIQLGYDVTSNVDLYISYRHVFGNDYTHNVSADNHKAPKMDLVGLGVNYTF